MAAGLIKIQMATASIKDAERIKRKTHIPEQHRTPKRSQAADWIEEHAADDWRNWTHTEIADETGFSRQHIDNVVEYYFEPAGADSDVEALADELGLGNVSSLERAVGGDVSRELLIYRLGYRDGQRDARKEYGED